MSQSTDAFMAEEVAVTLPRSTWCTALAAVHVMAQGTTDDNFTKATQKALVAARDAIQKQAGIAKPAAVAGEKVSV